MKVLPNKCLWCGGEPCSNDPCDEGRDWCSQCGKNIEGPTMPEASMTQRLHRGTHLTFNQGCDEIQSLVKQGILGPEEIPMSNDYINTAYWHWSVRKPELLPDWLKAIYEQHGEIRW